MVLVCLGHPLSLLLDPLFGRLPHQGPLVRGFSPFCPHRLLLLEAVVLLAVEGALAAIGSATTIRGMVTLSLTASRSSRECLLVVPLQHPPPPASPSRILRGFSASLPPLALPR